MGTVLKDVSQPVGDDPLPSLLQRRHPDDEGASCGVLSDPDAGVPGAELVGHVGRGLAEAVGVHLDPQPVCRRADRVVRHLDVGYPFQPAA